MKRQICITKKDIINAINVQSYDIETRSKLCPIAQSLRRNKIKFKYVERYKIDFGNRKKVDLPLKAKKFIKMFDESVVVYPFRFIIDIPEQNMLSINH